MFTNFRRGDKAPTGRPESPASKKSPAQSSSPHPPKEDRTSGESNRTTTTTPSRTTKRKKSLFNLLNAPGFAMSQSSSRKGSFSGGGDEGDHDENIHFLDRDQVPGLAGSDDDLDAPRFRYADGSTGPVRKKKILDPMEGLADLWHKPTPEQMIDRLKVMLMMPRGPRDPLPLASIQYVNVLIEEFGNMQINLAKEKEKVEKGIADRRKDLERFVARSSEWIDREKEFKEEIRRLEKLLARESKDGMEAVALARSGSVVNRTDTRKFTARLHETADEAGDVISEVGSNGVAQRTPTTETVEDCFRSALSDSVAESKAVISSPEEDLRRIYEPSEPPVPRALPAFILDNENDYLVSEQMRKLGPSKTKYVGPSNYRDRKPEGPCLSVLAAQDRAYEKAKKDAIDRAEEAQKAAIERERARNNIEDMLHHTTGKLEQVAENQPASFPYDEGQYHECDLLDYANIPNSVLNLPKRAKDDVEEGADDDMSAEKEALLKRAQSKTRTDRPVDSSSSSDSSDSEAGWLNSAPNPKYVVMRAGDKGKDVEEHTVDIGEDVGAPTVDKGKAPVRPRHARVRFTPETSSSSKPDGTSSSATAAGEVADDEHESDEGSDQIGDTTITQASYDATASTNEPKSSDGSSRRRPFSFQAGDDVISALQPALQSAPAASDGSTIVTDSDEGTLIPEEMQTSSDTLHQGLAHGPSSEDQKVSTASKQTLIHPTSAPAPVKSVTAGAAVDDTGSRSYYFAEQKPTGVMATEPLTFASAAHAAGLDQWTSTPEMGIPAPILDPYKDEFLTGDNGEDPTTGADKDEIIAVPGSLGVASSGNTDTGTGQLDGSSSAVLSSPPVAGGSSSSVAQQGKKNKKKKNGKKKNKGRD